MNHINFFVYLITIFLFLLQKSTLGYQNSARNLNLGWLHMCELKFVLEITSVRQSTKKPTGMHGCLQWSYWGYQQDQQRKLERSPSRGNFEIRRFKYVASHPRSEWYSRYQLTKWSNVPQPSYHHQQQVFSYTTMPRISKLNMSQADQDLNCQLKKRLNTPFADDERSTSNGWVIICHQKDEVKRSRWPWQNSTIISQVTWFFAPSVITIHIQLIFFTHSLSKNLGGLLSLFHYWKLGNFLVKLHLSTPSVLHHV